MAPPEGDASHLANCGAVGRHPHAFAVSPLERKLEKNSISRNTNFDYHECAETPSRSSASLNRRSVLTHPAPSLERQQRLAEQGWVEKFGRTGRGGHTRRISWKIERAKPGASLEALNAKADKRAPHQQINAKFQSSAEKERLMAELTEKNSKDASFQDRFQATLAKHDGRKVPTGLTLRDHIGNNSHTEMSKLTKQECKMIEEQRVVERSMADADRAKRNNRDSLFQDRFQAMLTKHDGKKVPAHTTKVHLTNDIHATEIHSEMSNDEKTREAAKHDEKGATESREIIQGDLKNKDGKRDRSDAARKIKASCKGKNRSGREMEAQRIAEEAKADSRFQESFEQILAKHDGKKDHCKQETTVDDYSRATKNAWSEHGGKRKRASEDEDEIQASMQHMRVQIRRKRRRIVDPADFPIDFRMQRVDLSSPRQRAATFPRSDMNKWGRPLLDPGRFSREIDIDPDRRGSYEGNKHKLDSYRGDRRIRERGTGYRSLEPSQWSRSAKHGDFINFSDHSAPRFDDRASDRTEGKYWEGFRDSETMMYSMYSEMKDELDEYKESRKYPVEYEHRGERSRRCRASPRPVGRKDFF